MASEEHEGGGAGSRSGISAVISGGINEQHVETLLAGSITTSNDQTNTHEVVTGMDDQSPNNVGTIENLRVVTGRDLLTEDRVESPEKVLDTKLGITEYRNKLVYKALVAKKLEKYDDMALAVCSIASLHTDLNKYERELFLTCYGKRIANALQSLRILKGMEETGGANNSCLKVIKDYILETEKLLEKICYDAIEVADKDLLPFCVGSESKGMYYKIIGDCNWLIFQNNTRDLLQFETAVKAYEIGFANMLDGDICPSDPTRLGIAVNLSAAYHALNSPTRAFKIATEALDAAAAVATPVPDETEMILTLLRENLRRWNEIGPSPQEQNLTVRTSGIGKSLSAVNADPGAGMGHELMSVTSDQTVCETVQVHLDGFHTFPYITQPSTPTMRIDDSLRPSHLSFEELFPGFADFPPEANPPSQAESVATPTQSSQSFSGLHDDIQEEPGQQSELESAPLGPVMTDEGTQSSKPQVHDQVMVNDGGLPLVYNIVEPAPNLTLEEPPLWDDPVGNRRGGKKYRPSMKKKAIEKGSWG